MRNRAGLLILLALAAGVLAAILAYSLLRSPQAPEIAQPTGNAPVVVAARDLEVGETLAPEDVKVIDWPGNATPAGYAQSADEIVGRGVVQSLSANEPVLPFKLASADMGRGLSMLVPEGMRAVTVPVDDVVAVGGWVRPGTRVDVIVTLDRQGGSQGEPMTQVVLQHVEVLGTDRVIARDEEGEAVETSFVTLLVDPEDAEKLALAKNDGRLHLALRNNLDLEVVETSGVRASRLLPLQRVSAPVVRSRRPAPPPRPSSLTIDVYRGPEKSESTVGMEGGA